MRIYIVQYEMLDFMREVLNPQLNNITEDNPSSVAITTYKFPFCYDLGEDEYAVGLSDKKKLVIKKDAVSLLYMDEVMSLYETGWLQFFITDSETLTTVKSEDRFILALLTTTRKSSIIFIEHDGYKKIGKIESKFALEIVRCGQFTSIVDRTEQRYWYTMRVPLIRQKNEIEELYTILRGLQYMYNTKQVIYNNIEGMYNGYLDFHSFTVMIDRPRDVLLTVIDMGKNHEHFTDIYDKVIKQAERAIIEDKDLLFRMATIYDIYKFIDRVYPDYIDNYVELMKEYFEAIFKSRTPEKSPIDVTILDFEARYKKKIEQ